ncbi:MAG TPA: adenylate/guanylate cyclase domain-containing protein [Lacunisphaera sp.]|nr:adenylate/guanylate cyclase domain-containing protein [Lacunisphaera sp.]
MPDAPSAVELRLLLEEVCADLCRFEQTIAQGRSADAINITREANVGHPGCFADILIQPHGQPAKFVEVNFGYTNEALLKSLKRKFHTPTPVTRSADAVVLVVDEAGRTDYANLVEQARAALHGGLVLEVWTESRLREMIRLHFKVDVDRFDPDRLLDVRAAIEHAMGRHAFKAPEGGPYEHDALRSQLLWHLGFWRVRELYEKAGRTRHVLQPATYPEVAIVMADICSFSGFVRDTADARVVREQLTSFYAKVRSQIIDRGGLMYQFVGDEAVGIFGLPDRREGYLEAAYETARAICSIGKSVASQWQRRIDRLQPAHGVHVGMALAELELLSLRPYSRTHIGFVGDGLNVAARLMAQAGCDEIVISNSLYSRISPRWQSEFTEIEPIEARNVGRIVGWKSRVVV